MALIAEFGWISANWVPEAAQYSAFLQNFAMSLFLPIYWLRNKGHGREGPLPLNFQLKKAESGTLC